MNTIGELRAAILRQALRPMNYSWPLAAIQSLCFVGAAYWFQVPPSSGVAVIVVGLVAVVMAVRAEEEWGRPERIAWLFLAVILSIVAIRAVNEEDAQRERQFIAVVEGLNATIQASTQQFRATMNKENSILDTTKQAAELSRENLASLSGEGSYPCIVPQSHAVVNGSVPLVVWNKGLRNLTGVEIRILSEREFLDGGSIFYKPPAELGTLRSEWPKPLPEGVIPKPGDNGVANYIAEIWTQNGYYTEVINFRRGKYMLPWAYQYWLTKQFGFPHRLPLKTEIKEQRRVVKACGQNKWSDDLGDGRPITKP